jgi:hypothetical protein
MRIPQQRSVRGSGYGPTQPSQPRHPGGTTGPQGTPGGKARKPGVQGKRMILGIEVYLWILVLIEAALTGVLRKYFRRFHGG